MTCADKCEESCFRCFHLAEGRTVCGGELSSSNAQQCLASSDCDPTPTAPRYCVLSMTRRDGNTPEQSCFGVPTGVGCCYFIPPCT